ncbi:MAG: Cu-Zn family superoxide dismutase, partial [Patiriisocius sp.]
MKTYFLIPIAAATLLFTSCKNEVKETKIVEQKVKQSLDAKKAKYTVVPVNEEKLITFKLEPKSDSKATGTVVFSQKGEMVTFKASLEGLTPGMHAIHIHEKADCSSVDGKS